MNRISLGMPIISSLIFVGNFIFIFLFIILFAGAWKKEKKARSEVKVSMITCITNSLILSCKRMIVSPLICWICQYNVLLDISNKAPSLDVCLVNVNLVKVMLIT
jgi:hypothetical protein